MNGNETKNREPIEITWDYLFEKSKLEFWSVILFLLISLAAALLRLLRKRRQNAGNVESTGSRETGARPTDEAHGAHGGTAGDAAGDRSENGGGERGDEEDKEGGGRAGVGFSRTLGRISWRW